VYRDFKIERNFFAAAVLIVNNAKIGRVFKAGEANPELLLHALGF
jgi:methenyltetrahydromethanopterin cyclohydrolase